MAERVIQTSFSSGELSPKLYARVDLDKYGSGAALMRNFFTDYRGGASNRAGTKFIGRAKSNATGDARLIPFTYSTDQAYILEVGNLYIRFIANEEYLTEIPTTITGITQANPAVVTDAAHGYTTGDEVEIEGVGGMVEVNDKNFIVTVLSSSTYSLHDLNGNNINSTGFTSYSSGGTAARIYTLTSPYTTANLPLLKYTQDANTLTFVHPSHPPYDLTRTGASTFTLTQVVFGPALAGSSPITCTTVNESNDKSAYSYTVTGVNDKGEEGIVPFPTFIATAILNQTTNTFNTIKWAPVTGAVSYRVYKAGPWASILNGTGKATPPSVTYGFIGTAVGTTFIDVNIAPDYSQSPPTFQDPVSPGQIATLNVTAGGTGYNVDDWLVLISASGGGGAGFYGYGLIDPNTGTITSTWLVNPGFAYTTTPPLMDDGANTATYSVTLGPATGTYPAAVGYHQQRRFYGGTDNFPESFFASQTGSYNNFDTNTILLDSDAISASIASRQVNAIKSFTSMPTGLVVLTTGGGFLVSGGGGGAAITPTNIEALQQPSSGCNDLPPLVVNQDILYCQNRGFVVRDLAFSFYTQSYLGTDRSVLASHLFENFLPIAWTYAEQPYRQILTVRNDGHMLAFTYVPEQEMYAWSQYDTQGFFLSVASIPEADINATYTLVKRHVVNPLGGECWVNYVERFDPRLFDCLLEAWFLDCALEHPKRTIDADLYLSGTTDNITVYAYDPCLPEPDGNGPFYSSTFQAQRIFSTPGTQTWTVGQLADGSIVPWDSADNIIHSIGGGGDGAASGGLGAGGGAGGQYSTISNLALTTSASASLQVGAHGQGGGGTPTSPTGGDTWFSSSHTLFAQAGDNGPNAVGGSFAGPGATYSGGGTDSQGGAGTGGSGGSGAAGPNGPGGSSGTPNLFPFTSGGTGGGGANGGATSGSAGGAGSDGGNNRLGVGGGHGSTSSLDGPGDPGTAGGGGGGGYGGGAGQNGGAGSQDDIWFDDEGTPFGPGSGGGAGGWTDSSGANAGGRGGGGGGRSAVNSIAGVNGFGTDGLIVAIWGPTVIRYTVNPGDVIQIGCGKVLVTDIIDTWTLQGTVIAPLDIDVPDDPTGLSFPIRSGVWTVTTPITEVDNLDYLEGKIVWALADGVVRGPFTVTASSITLPVAATNIIVGLKYQSQLKTLEIDVGNPTVQGKRKQIAATTARLNLTCGLKAGRTFAGVVPMKECAPTTPPSLFSADARTIINAAWDKPGQVCYQQNDPLPVTILGVIPEVVVGDTGK